MTRCPWNGTECGCGSFPDTVNGLMPERCEAGLSLGMMAAKSTSSRVRPEALAVYTAWRTAMDKNNADEAERIASAWSGN